VTVSQMLFLDDDREPKPKQTREAQRNLHPERTSFDYASGSSQAGGSFHHWSHPATTLQSFAVAAFRYPR